MVGRDRQDPLVEAADEYLSRVHRTMPIELVELKEVPLRKSSSPDLVMAAEADRIRRALGRNDRVVALDRKGRTLSSEALAERLKDAMNSGRGALTLVIGGPSGLHSEFLEGVHERWSLSTFTLPHRIARLVLCEQLYRACSILRGEPYHK